MASVAGTAASAADARRRVEQAHELYSRAQFDECLALCSACEASNEASDELFLLAGAAAFQLRRYRDAAALNLKALELNPQLAEAMSNLANSLRESGELERAIELYRRAIEIKPYFVDAYTNLAALLSHLRRTDEAVQCYRAALVHCPQNVDLLNNLGNLIKAQGKLEEARVLYEEATRLRPTFAVAHSNLASVLRELGQLDDALLHFEKAIEIDPTLADAFSNMGNLFKDLSNYERAEKCYKQAIVLRPNFAIAYGNLASVHVDRAQFSRALELYSHAVALDATQPDFFDNMGLCYRGLGQLAEAARHHQLALELQANRPHTYNNLGNAFKEQGLLKEAMEAYTQAITLSPTFAAAHSNLANVFREQGRLPDALAHYRQALEIRPDFPDAFSNMGNVFKDMSQFDRAIECYRRAIELKPDFADAHSNLASVFKDTGNLQSAIDSYRRALELKPFFPDAFCNLVHCLQMICDWRDRPAIMAQLKDTVRKQLEMGVTPSVQPHHALVYPIDGESMLTICTAYARQIMRNVECARVPAMAYPKSRADGRLRIGYVSSDFGNHPLCDLMSDVFGMHDTARFEVYCFALSADDGSANYAKVTREVEHFVDVSAMTFEETAVEINKHQIHVLINLNGYTKGARNETFALRPAPVQAMYMGFPGSSGAPFIDYLITDRVTTPPACSHLYSEAFAYMPHSYFVTCYQQSYREVLQPTLWPTRESLGLPADRFVFLCANQLYKIDPATFDCWMEILHAVPDSILWLLRFPPKGEPFVVQEAQRRGIDESRIVFSNQLVKREHLLRCTRAGAFLDTPVCNGHTTACDVLWAGVPIVTMPQEKFASRVAASILHAAGLGDLVVETYAQYKALAVRLATDTAFLRATRERVAAARDSPLFDTRLWTAEVEAAYEVMWQRHESGQKPATFDVPSVAADRA